MSAPTGPMDPVVLSALRDEFEAAPSPSAWPAVHPTVLRQLLAAHDYWVHTSAALAAGLTSTRAVEMRGKGSDDGGSEAEPAPKCTGVAARWCAVHGDCSCPLDDGSDWRRTLTRQSCPLHSDASTHAGEAGQ